MLSRDYPPPQSDQIELGFAFRLPITPMIAYFPRLLPRGVSGQSGESDYEAASKLPTSLRFPLARPKELTVLSACRAQISLAMLRRDICSALYISLAVWRTLRSKQWSQARQVECGHPCF